MEPLVRRAREAFGERFGATPEVVAVAPGRVELLGNHTDYNGGFVLSVALELAAAAAARRWSEPPPRARLWSEALGAEVAVRLPVERPLGGSWADYPLGVAREIERLGVRLEGFEAAYVADLPLGSGLSSSAAIELATAEVLFSLFGGRPEDLFEVAKLCQRAEVEFVGVPCGILDQFSSAFGRRNHALFLDCTTLEYERLPLGHGEVVVVIADTRIRHALADGKYAELRALCERARDRLAELLGRPLATLRNVRLDEFLNVAGGIEPEARRRAEHVLRENARVLAGREALRAGRIEDLGRLMFESHASSRDLFGNSTPELDALVEAAKDLPGVLGAKLSGGGFGGATVNLVRAAEAQAFASGLSERYATRFGAPPRILVSGIGDGARAVPFEGAG